MALITSYPCDMYRETQPNGWLPSGILPFYQPYHLHDHVNNPWSSCDLTPPTTPWFPSLFPSYFPDRGTCPSMAVSAEELAKKLGEPQGSKVEAELIDNNVVRAFRTASESM